MNALALAALARVVLAVSEPSQTPPPTPLPTAVNEKQESINTKATSSPTEPPIISPADKHDRVNEQRPDRHKEPSNDSMIRFTGILAFAALVQLVVMGIQSRFMQLTRRSYEEGERGRLFVTKINLIETAAKQVIVRYTLYNTGRTSADVYERSVNLVTECKESYRLPTAPEYGPATQVFFTIGPDRDIDTSAGFNDMTLGEQVLGVDRIAYFFGYINYTDAFKRAHTSRFGFKWRDNQVSFISDIPGYNADV